jgi:hypothetical protein
MVKLCGFYSGYCTNPGPCDLVIESWPSPAKWREIRKAARICPYRAAKNPTGLVVAHELRRRRDWQVGNPYKKGA